jgi:hypothetical protein
MYIFASVYSKEISIIEQYLIGVYNGDILSFWSITLRLCPSTNKQ